MKKIVVALTVIEASLLMAALLPMVLNARPFSTGARLPSSSVRPSSIGKKTENLDNSKQNSGVKIGDEANSNLDENKANTSDESKRETQSELDAKQSPDVSSKENQCNTASTNSNSEPNPEPDPNPAANPPDGAIFYGGEAPYAYIPTYSPKNTFKLPVAPPEPEN